MISDFEISTLCPLLYALRLLATKYWILIPLYY
jgi:hypothetical protein